MNIEHPPASSFENFGSEEMVRYWTSGDVNNVVRKANYEYLYWSELKRQKLPDGFVPGPVWLLVKSSRLGNLRELAVPNIPGCRFRYQVTEPTLEKLHRFDLYMGGIMQTDSLIPAEDRTRYLVGSIMEEAIASSQLEGAATTREVAKDMLRKKRKPRNASELMIFNNYQTIQYILEQKKQALTPEMLCQIQARMTQGSLGDPAHEGQFRQNDDVRVEDFTTGEVVHVPPLQRHLPELLRWYCALANDEIPSQSGTSGSFIHPIVRASILHFLIGYIHPFADGNGRTARAVFYWYLLRKGYWQLEYMSISRIIHKSASQYARAYLYTEYDGNDLTYFINYQVKTLDLAFTSLQQYIERKVAEKKQLRSFRQFDQFNQRQVSILQELITDPDAIWTIREVQHRFGVVYDTARNDLMHLENMGLLDKRREGKLRILYLRAENFEEAVARLKGGR
ncbi:Fic family protein [Hymenobacter monticola]|uniref:Fic family protein n=1 Tax=Hymenobacter monticola TaxID=1705399 RepID=A0ABY4B8N3_9BACT|nr:Fic family protein [Hymenobacter monticola]UOE34652.1 Fic family protein [Hymenobacter monticola]